MRPNLSKFPSPQRKPLLPEARKQACRSDQRAITWVELETRFVIVALTQVSDQLFLFSAFLRKASEAML